MVAYPVDNLAVPFPVAYLVAPFPVAFLEAPSLAAFPEAEYQEACLAVAFPACRASSWAFLARHKDSPDQAACSPEFDKYRRRPDREEASADNSASSGRHPRHLDSAAEDNQEVGSQAAAYKDASCQVDTTYSDRSQASSAAPASYPAANFVEDTLEAFPVVASDLGFVDHREAPFLVAMLRTVES